MYGPERRRGLMAINHQTRQSQNVNFMVLGSLCKGVFELHASTGSEGALVNWAINFRKGCDDAGGGGQRGQ